MIIKNESFFVDTHCHVDLYQDPKRLIEQIEKKQIYTIALTNTPSVFFHTYKLTENKKYIRPALGFHPQLIKSRKNELSSMWYLFDKTRYIGEVGLDFSNSDDSEKKEQVQAFEKIINKSAEYKNKILSVHSRRSAKEVISIIGNNFPGKIILHWYSGNITTLRKAIMNGAYFSINYSMINSKSGIKILKEIPIDRLLTETDGPLIKRNNSDCSPLDVPKIITGMSQVLNITPVNMKHNIYKNFISLF